MTPPADPPQSDIFAPWFCLASRVLAGGATLLGAAVLLGWACGVRALTTVFPGFEVMRAMTALLLALGGVAVLCMQRPRERARITVLLLGGVIAATSALTLLEYAGDVDLGVDLLLFADAQLRDGGPLPGRMGPYTARGLLALGAALLSTDIETERGVCPSELLSLLVLAASGVAFVGYVYGASSLFSLGGFSAIALQSAVGFTLLGLGILFARPKRGMMRLVASETAGGMLARRLLPLSILVPFALGLLLVDVASPAHLQEVRRGAALLVAATIGAFVTLVYITACALNRAEERATTERETLIGELRSALRARERFLSIASHELRTPLAALSLQVEGMLRALERQATNAERDRMLRRLDTAFRQTARLKALIESLLDVSRIDSGRLDLDRAEVDMAEIVHDVTGRMSETAARSGSALRVRAAGKVTGWWDRSRVEQVLTNLLANAVKYGAGSPIDVTLDAGDDRVEVTVRDRGIGIAEGDAQRIFGAFERAAPARHYGGLGLGLYISKQIVDAHGGSIDVESAAGQGTSFTVSLPRRPPAAEAAPAHEPEPSPE